MAIFVTYALGPGLPAGNVTLRVIVASAAAIGAVYLLSLKTSRRIPPAV